MMLSRLLRSAEGGRILFWCPGCGESHMIRVEGESPGCWGYNGNPDAPTFSPSILVTGSQKLTDEQWAFIDGGGKIEPVRSVCHSFVVDGQIQFLGDCTHALASQTVPLPDFPEGEE